MTALAMNLSQNGMRLESTSVKNEITDYNRQNQETTLSQVQVGVQYKWYSQIPMNYQKFHLSVYGLLHLVEKTLVLEVGETKLNKKIFTFQIHALSLSALSLLSVEDD